MRCSSHARRGLAAVILLVAGLGVAGASPARADVGNAVPAQNAEAAEIDRAAVERGRQKRMRDRRKEALKLWRQVKQRIAGERRRAAGDKGTAARMGFTNIGRGAARSRRRALRRWFARWQQFRANPRKGRLVILQLGDSHTAGDYFSAYLRHRFQARLGDGGRGMMPAGIPHRYFRMNNATARQTGNWRTYAMARDDDPGPFGLTGYRLGTLDAAAAKAKKTKRTRKTRKTAAKKGQDDPTLVSVSMDGLQTFSRAEIEFLRHPKGGHFTVEIDGKKVARVTSRAASRRPSRLIFTPRRPGRTLTIRPEGDGKVQLLSWSLLKKSGAVYINLGMNGQTAEVLERWSPTLVKWQLRHLKPDLILFAFGTNEGFDHKLKLGPYKQAYTQRLAQLRRWAPKATIVLVGAPNAARLPSWCGRGKKRRERYKCRPLAKKHARSYARLIDKRSRALCYWHTPPMLAKVVALQKRIARQQGLVYWDWAKVMGRPCGMDRWARKKEPLAYRDRVHMQVPGYDVSGEALFQFLTNRKAPPL